MATDANSLNFETGGAFTPPCSPSTVVCANQVGFETGTGVFVECCSGGDPIDWTILIGIWRSGPKPSEIVNVVNDPPAPLLNRHRACLRFAKVVNSAITTVFGGSLPLVVRTTLLANLVTGTETGTWYYAVEFFGTQTPKEMGLPRVFTSSDQNYVIYLVTFPS